MSTPSPEPAWHARTPRPAARHSRAALAIPINGLMRGLVVSLTHVEIQRDGRPGLARIGIRNRHAARAVANARRDVLHRKTGHPGVNDSSLVVARETNDR